MCIWIVLLRILILHTVPKATPPIISHIAQTGTVPGKVPYSCKFTNAARRRKKINLHIMYTGLVINMDTLISILPSLEECCTFFLLHAIRI